MDVTTTTTDVGNASLDEGLGGSVRTSDMSKPSDNRTTSGSLSDDACARHDVIAATTGEADVVEERQTTREDVVSVV